VIDVTLAPVTDFAALGERWRILEQRVTCSFFQSWTWMGCLAEERFPDPVLLEARASGETVALALFNRRRFPREVLYLGETGNTAHDSPFIEYNAPLVAADAGPEVAAACLRAARRAPVGTARAWLPRRLVLSGVDDAGLAAARASGPVGMRRTEIAPTVDLAGLRREGRDFLDGLSANTRYQLRRSDRAYAASGALEVAPARARDDAHAWLDELAGLHQATWTQRGAAGAFATRFFTRFHHALIDRALERDEADLLRITAGERRIGFLYNFRFSGRALAYQSGFDYASAGRHEKPGLTCHHQAIRHYAGKGLRTYDFLAGEARYKRSLADGGEPLHWVTVGRGGRTLAFGRRAVRALVNHRLWRPGRRGGPVAGAAA